MAYSKTCRQHFCYFWLTWFLIDLIDLIGEPIRCIWRWHFSLSHVTCHSLRVFTIRGEDLYWELRIETIEKICGICAILFNCCSVRHLVWKWTKEGTQMWDSVKCGCGRRMRTADNYKIRKIRKDRSFSSFNLRAIACNLYPCGLLLIQKWQVPKHLDLKGRLMSRTLCKTNLSC